MLELKNRVQERRKEIEEKMQTLKAIYNNLTNKNRKKIYMFCIESFFFQYKMLSHEEEYLKKSVDFVKNGIYGDYWKLLKIMELQIAEKKIEIVKKEDIKYTEYNELETFNDFTDEEIKTVFASILQILDELCRYYYSKTTEHNIFNYKLGNSILNFIHTVEYEKTVLREQISLFFGYVEFFNKMQTTYLEKLLQKMDGFFAEMTQDILSTPREVDQCSSIKTIMDSEPDFAESQVDFDCQVFFNTEKSLESNISSSSSK
jgi:hypothetical protein